MPARYAHVFNTTAEFEAEYNGSAYHEPWVSYNIEEADQGGTGVAFNKPGSPGPEPTSCVKMHVISTTGGSIVWTAFTGDSTARTLEYSSNNGSTWTSLPAGGTISVTPYNTPTYLFRAPDNTTYDSMGLCTFCGTTVSFTLEGNIMALLGQPESETLTAANTFYHLFQGCTGLTDASGLELPATGLTDGCYREMFKDCISLAYPPELPATTLAENCYRAMFLCTSASVGTNTAMTTAPELPAEVVPAGGYQLMFRDCANINYIKCLATNISATDCTKNWLQGVSATGTITKLAGVSYASGPNGIPTGWTVVDI